MMNLAKVPHLGSSFYTGSSLQLANRALREPQRHPNPIKYHCSCKARDVLSSTQRSKLNIDKDSEFYAFPRFVNHADGGFIQSLKDVYEEYFVSDLDKLNLGGKDNVDPDNIVILDLASSHVSHMPDAIASSPSYTVIGHGMNAKELAKNPILDRFFVRDFNTTADDPWALESSSVDAVCICCSVQYFQYPEKVFSEIYRVLRPGGVAIISFTNRMFWEKAIQGWRDSNDYGRIQLVKQYFMSVRTEDMRLGFTLPTQLEAPKAIEATKQSFVSLITSFILSDGNKDPFYCVVAYKNMQ